MVRVFHFSGWKTMKVRKLRRASYPSDEILKAKCEVATWAGISNGVLTIPSLRVGTLISSPPPAMPTITTLVMLPPVFSQHHPAKGIPRFPFQIYSHGFTRSIDLVKLVKAQKKQFQVGAQSSIHTVSAELQEAVDKVYSAAVPLLQDSDEGGPSLSVISGSEGASSTDVNPPQPELDLLNKSSDVETLGSNTADTSEAVASSSVTDTLSSSGGPTVSVISENGDTPPIDVNPPQPELDLLNKSSDVETLGSNSADASQAVVSGGATESLPSDGLKSAKEAYEAMLGGNQDTKQPDSEIDALSQASQSLTDSISETKSVVVNSFSKLKESTENFFNDVIANFKSTYEDINGPIVKSMKTFSVQEGDPTKIPTISQDSTTQGLYEILKSPFQIGTPENNALKVVVTSVENVVGKILAEAGKLAANGYVSTKETLPVDVQLYLDTLEKKVTEISEPVQSILKQIYGYILETERTFGVDPDNPIISVILFVGGSVSIGTFFWQSRYGGYSGDLTPAAALGLLGKEGNVIVVDVRPESIRESDGIPDLRRQARFKIANVETLPVESSVGRMLKSVSDAEAAVTAALIKNLKIVQPNTKVIIMDADGSQSKRIARALKKAGVKMPYRIIGGFKAWRADGLRVKQTGVVTPLTIIKEETEAILEDIKPSPTALVAATMGLFAGVYALIEWEKTLQLLGLICIGQVLYTRLNSYETAEDAKNDLKLLLRPFALATQGIVWVAGQAEPNKLQLPTSPSTSDVQDRVLQAAAKHGTLPPGSDQAQQDMEEPTGKESDEAVVSED